MKKALKKEISNMLKTSIMIMLNSIDEKAASKISKSVDKVADRLTKKFGKKFKLKGKVKGNVEELVGKKKKKSLVPVESTGE